MLWQEDGTEQRVAVVQIRQEHVVTARSLKQHYLYSEWGVARTIESSECRPNMLVATMARMPVHRVPKARE